jgi:proline iminopeptidase
VTAPFLPGDATCGRSTPHASDPAADMSLNTTQHLIDDMERLREHLGIERWLLNGASWGVTLILAYAQQHRERVSQVVIQAVTMTRRTEIDWLYRGAGRFYPEAWDRFRNGVGEQERDGDVLAAYVRRMENPDRAIREKAAADMGSPVQTAWELAKAWPDARLHIIEDSGHAGSDAMQQAVRTAIEEFKSQ